MGAEEYIKKGCPRGRELSGEFPFEQCDRCPNKVYDDDEGLLYCKLKQNS